MVKFEKISTYKNVDFELPKRSTEKSAGYDFVVPTDITIPSLYKNLYKMIKEHITKPETQIKIADWSLVKELAEDSEMIANATKEEQTAYGMKTIQRLPELADDFGELMTLSLEEVKELAKNTNSRATLIPTGVKAKLKDNQKLELLIRSSTPLNSYIVMANSVGLIDADYYNNESNEGHIFFQVLNLSPFDIKLKKGDRIGQGVISTYETTDEDNAKGKREGGFGSTKQ